MTPKIAASAIGFQSHPAAADGAPDESANPSYRLVSIAATSAPSGCTGRDWLVYRIAQGGNLITGYRQGDVRTATAAVEQIVNDLNDRRSWAKPRTRSKHARPPAPVRPAEEPED
jgi:hypothetical protein